jgi:hypothetical protein
VVGSLVEGNVWSGSTEPSGWQITATQSLLLGAGQAGTRTTGSYVDYANFAQTPITQITGTVTDASTGKPITGATVSLGGGSTTTTDVNGTYSLILTGAASGSSTVTASASGFASASSTLTLTPGVTTTVNFSLT